MSDIIKPDAMAARVKKHLGATAPAGKTGGACPTCGAAKPAGGGTSSDVSSPTSTKTSTETSTKADTRNNVTVTGGAGDGDTVVTIKK